jgi:hypothetical protein
MALSTFQNVRRGGSGNVPNPAANRFKTYHAPKVGQPDNKWMDVARSGR